MMRGYEIIGLRIDSRTDASAILARPVDLPVGPRTPKEIRVEWKLGVVGASGGGLWFPETTENRAMLSSTAEFQCQRHGEGTHWVAERQA